MTQRSLIKDGIVINIVELDDDTVILTKALHKELSAKEDLAYQAELEEWRKALKSHKAEFDLAVNDLGMARMTLSAMKTNAISEMGDAKAALALRQILAIDADIIDKEKALDAIKVSPFPAKPILIRSKRWFHPDGLAVGPDGGNIGDIWDGKKYKRPEKAI